MSNAIRPLINVHLFLLLCFLFTGLKLEGQKKIKSGHIQYKIVDITTDEQEVALLENTVMNIYFADQMHKVEIVMLGGIMKIQTITNQADQTNTVLTDLMGRQIKVMSPVEDTTGVIYQIKHLREEKKKIASYKCHKVIMTGDQGEVVELYVTSKIKMKSYFFNKLFPGLKEFPLQYTVKEKNVQMTYAANLVDGQGAKEEVFAIPDAYEEMSLEEFEQEIGTMNLGF